MISRSSIVFVALAIVVLHGWLGIAAIFETATGGGALQAALLGGASLLALLSLVCHSVKTFRASWVLAAAAGVLGIVSAFTGGFCFGGAVAILAGIAASITRNFDIDDRMRNIAADAHELDPPG